MSQRKNRREPGVVKPLSDKSKLLWEKYWTPMNAAAQGLNAAINNTMNLLGAIIIEMEGLDPTTHLFDADNLRIISRPNAPKGPQLVSGDGKMGG